MAMVLAWQAAYGEGLRVVGNLDDLGAWDVAAAPAMHWTEGHVWVADLRLPAAMQAEFKLVHSHYNGTTWEPSTDRCVLTCRPWQ